MLGSPRSQASLQQEGAFLQELGRHVASLRRERGLTQSAIRDRTGLSVEYLSRLENGRGNPTLLTLKSLVQDGLACPLRSFFKGLD